MTAVKETHLRTVAKTVVYRILAIISVMLITLAFGASTSTAGTVGLVVLIAGTTVYYLHDRVWMLFGWNQTDGNDAVKRSLVKTVVYRVLIMIVAFITAKVFVTENNSAALAFTAAQMAVNLVLYYIIERAFNKLAWGKLTPTS